MSEEFNALVAKHGAQNLRFQLLTSLVGMDELQKCSEQTSQRFKIAPAELQLGKMGLLGRVRFEPINSKYAEQLLYISDLMKLCKDLPQHYRIIEPMSGMVSLGSIPGLGEASAPAMTPEELDEAELDDDDNPDNWTEAGDDAPVASEVEIFAGCVIVQDGWEPIPDHLIKSSFGEESVRYVVAGTPRITRGNAFWINGPKDEVIAWFKKVGGSVWYSHAPVFGKWELKTLEE